MWIVELALSRPYTFVVLALLLFLVSPVVMMRTPVDSHSPLHHFNLRVVHEH
jgi:hypothetical protein